MIIYCSKIKHKSRGDALEAAVSAKTRGRRGQRGERKARDYKGKGAKISVYKCHICGSWHWGHRVKGSKHSRKRNKYNDKTP